MLSPFISHLASKHIVLASASPRRREILTLMQLPFTVMASTFPELLDKTLFPTPADYAMTNSKEKAIEIFDKLKSDKSTRIADLVIGSDTVVVSGGHILEKPANAEEALRMLTALSGTQHEVVSGVTLIYRNSFLPSSDAGAGDDSEVHVVSFSASTTVYFAKVDTDTLSAYIATGEPFDKAGAYGIQGIGGDFVTGIEGCYYNVMGFPRNAVAMKLAAILSGASISDTK